MGKINELKETLDKVETLDKKFKDLKAKVNDDIAKIKEEKSNNEKRKTSTLDLKEINIKVLDLENEVFRVEWFTEDKWEFYCNVNEKYGLVSKIMQILKNINNIKYEED